jgi:hypothetical protein
VSVVKALFFEGKDLASNEIPEKAQCLRAFCRCSTRTVRRFTCLPPDITPLPTTCGGASEPWLFYDRGLGTAQDHAAAAHWYRQAAETGEVQAQFNLADLYLRGEGVPEDEAAAFAWFQKAAFQGHTGAQAMAGSMLFAGRGAPKDLPGAYFWIFAAVSESDARGIPTLRALESQMPRVEIEEAKARAESFTAAHQAASDVALSH